LIPGSGVEIGRWAFDGCVSLSESHSGLPSKLAYIVCIGASSCGGDSSLIVGSVKKIVAKFVRGSRVHESFIGSDYARFHVIDIDC
jgi:hypothetical protein